MVSEGVDPGSYSSDRNPSPAPSTASDYVEEETALDPNQWVGEITTLVNFYRFNTATGQMYQAGTEYVLSPDGTVSPPESPQPRLLVGDVWRLGGGNKDLSEETACLWDWENLRRCVEEARSDYAFRRKNIVLAGC